MFPQKKISTYLIKKILRCFCIDVDATRTALLIGVNRKTVNHYFLRFRIAIYAHRIQEKRKIIGQAECDEAYFGARRRRGFHGKLKRSRGTLKQPVFGIFERHGEVFTEIVPDCKKQTLQDVILGKVAAETVIYTDGWRGYDGLVAVGYDKHLRVNHQKNEFSQGNGV